MNFEFLLFTINLDMFQSRVIKVIMSELTQFIIDYVILSNIIIIFLINLHVIIIALFKVFEFVIDKIKIKSMLIV